MTTGGALDRLFGYTFKETPYLTVKAKRIRPYWRKRSWLERLKWRPWIREFKAYETYFVQEPDTKIIVLHASRMIVGHPAQIEQIKREFERVKQEAVGKS